MSAHLEYLPQLPADKRVGIGCIGAGFIMADCHLVAYRQAGFNPVAIASARVEHAREVAVRHAIPHVYATYQELLADPQVEVVDVAVPPDVQFDVIRDDRHAAATTCAASWRKSRWASISTQARQIVELCEQAGITLAVNQNMRYDQSVRACKSLLDARRTGRAGAWRRSTCGPFRIGCRGSSGRAGSRCGS